MRIPWRKPVQLGTCGRCGRTTRNLWCDKCGFSHLSETTLRDLRAFLESTTEDIVVRTYRGSTAAEMFQREARMFADFGYLPASQSASTQTSGPSPESVFCLGMLAFAVAPTSVETLTVAFHRAQAPGRRQL